MIDPNKTFGHSVAVAVLGGALDEESFLRFAQGKTLEEIEAALEAGSYFKGQGKVAAIKWVKQKRKEQEDERFAATLLQATRAANAAAYSARWTMYAALASAVAAVVAVLGFYFVSIKGDPAPSVAVSAPATLQAPVLAADPKASQARAGR